MKSAGLISPFDKAIVTKLQGGLGNLLFQYFAGFALAEKYGCKLFCAQDGGVLHQSGLELVGIEPDYIDLSKDLLRRARRKKDHRLSDHFKSLFGLWPLTVVSEPYFHYWPGFNNLSEGVLLSGYWQSHRYFSSIHDQLHKVVDIDGILETCNQDQLNTILKQNSVCVHIRRGDFAQTPDALAVHGIISKGYYDQAREVLETNTTPDLYCVFSDAPELAKDMLSDWDQTVFIEGNNQQQDLALMASCDHNIIANSSFSWWGAMLNRNPEKQVFAPRNWFTQQGLQTRSLVDLFPDGWTIL